MIDFARIASAALTSIESLLERWLPGGVRQGHEYCVGNLRGEPGDSLKINLNTGVWKDFATGEAGGDLVSLYAAINGLSQGAAAKELAEQLGLVAGAPGPAPAQPDQGKKKPAPPKWTPIVPAPADVPRANPHHFKYGAPVGQWEYRTAKGELVGYVCRFVRSNGDKEILPLVWARDEHGARAWRWLSFPKPRPLYNLPELHKRADAPVLIVEGEKTADAARALLPLHVCITWPGGARAVGKADWNALRGRRVLIWPDADEPGREAAQAIADVLLSIAHSVRIVRVPEGVSQGWDLADAQADGWTSERAQQHVRDHLEPAIADAPADSGGWVPPDGGEPADIEVGPDPSSWQKKLIRKPNGMPEEIEENVLLVLENHPAWKGVLWWDEFATRVVARRKPPIYGGRVGEWAEILDLELKLWLTQQCRLVIRDLSNIGRGIRHHVSRHPFHPVREYLDSLVHDGESRVDDFFTNYLGVKATPYARLTSRFFWLGMVARVYEPGCMMRLVPVLEGEQFRGKSAALSIIGGEWFSDTPFVVGDKDAYLALRGKLLYEISEFDSFSRAEATRVKAFISSTTDNYRAPYDRSNSDWPRQTVFAATTNAHEFLKDPTGNSRFAPIAIGEISLEQIERDRDQLFAEAVLRYRAGERRYATREEQDRHFAPEQEMREIEDPWFSMIASWVNQLTSTRVTLVEIFEECLQIEASKIDNARQMATRVGIAMRRVGWVKRRETADGKRGYYYERPQADSGSKESKGATVRF